MADGQPCIEFGSTLGSGGPVVVLHGLGFTAALWRGVREMFAARPMLAPDLLGHGTSPWRADGDYSLAEHVAYILGVIDAADLNRISLVGHSLGAAIAARLASEHPDRVERLVLVDAGPVMERDGVRRIRQELAATPRVYPTALSYEQALKARMPLAEPALVRELAREGLRRRQDGRFEPCFDPRALQRQTGWMTVEDLRGIRCPTLVLRGEASSVLSQKTAERMAAEWLRSAELRVVPKAGHAVMIENSEAFRTAIGAFLGTLDPKAPSSATALPAQVEEPAPELIAVVRSIWSEGLSGEEPPTDVSFLGLGGNSLQAQMIAASLCERLPVAVEALDVLLAPSIRDLAAAIEGLLVERLTQLSEDEARQLLEQVA